MKDQENDIMSGPGIVMTSGGSFLQARANDLENVQIALLMQGA